MVAGRVPVRLPWAAMADVKLDHAAFGVPEAQLGAVADLLVGSLGGRAHGAGPGAGFRFWQWEFAGGGRIEILVPDGPPDGFLHRFLAARGAGPHHLTFKVPDIQHALARARERGYAPVGFDDTDPQWIEAFLHPKEAQGIVVQIVEAPPASEPPAPGEMAAFPPAPPPAEPARVLGFRLSSKSEARARLQWEDLLGGACERRSGDDLLFRWADSPLRVAVRVDAAAPEGPVALEVAAPQRMAIPDDARNVLGLPVVRVDGTGEESG